MNDKGLMSLEAIEKRILLIRGQKIMQDRDLAELYGVETKVLKRAVRRNVDRFPPDFMFVLSKADLDNLRCRIGTSRSGWGGTRYRPMAFTEQGVAMLSTVLNNKRAIQVNIEVMRAFVKLRRVLASQVKLVRRLRELEKKYDAQFRGVFQAIEQLMAPPEPKPKKIGFHVKESRARYGRNPTSRKPKPRTKG